MRLLSIAVAHGVLLSEELYQLAEEVDQLCDLIIR